MTPKNYGSLTSYLDPTEKSFETVVYQNNKPLNGEDLSLTGDVSNENFQKHLKASAPSGFLTGDFLADGNEDFTFGNTANEFYLGNKPLVHVNGWVLPIEYTGTSTPEMNRIQLEAPPSGFTYATDFVFLEVWRALVKANPETDNKPSASKLYRHGNVLSHESTWLEDDLKDTAIGLAQDIESTIRVQIQYRIRVQRLTSNQDRIGYTDLAVKAQGPNSSPSTISYQMSDTDSGLWVAGDNLGSGNEIEGTVDGHVYSIPVCMVWRRNLEGFDYQGNGHGANLLASGDSERPDGFYADQILFNDVQDLRNATKFGGWDWNQVLTKNTSLLLDQELRSWLTDSSHTGFYVGGKPSFGTRFLKADDIVPSKEYYGDPTDYDPPTGNSFRSADGICRSFSDRSHLERIVVEFENGANWVEGDALILDLTASGASEEMPSSAFISDILSIKLNDSDGTTTNPDIEIKSVSGLGTKAVTITLDATPFASDKDIWVTYEVSYPHGAGLTAHVTEEVTAYNVLVHNPASFNLLIDPPTPFTNDTAGREAIQEYLEVNFERGSHREVEVTYRHKERTITVYAKGNEILLPEYPWVEDANDPNTSITMSSGSILEVVNTTLILDGVVADGTSIDVTFNPRRALPINGAVFTLYYMTASIQAIPREYLDNSDDLVAHSLEIEPLCIPPYLYSGSVSSGSNLTPYPYEAPLNQIPVHVDAAYSSEAELNAPGPISVSGFSADTGFLQLPTLVPMASVSSIVLKHPVDVEGYRNREYIDHYRETEETEYKPSAFAQNLSSIVEHKVFIPVLARLKRDTDFARRGTVVLVIFTQYYDYNTNDSDLNIEENKIAFNGVNTCAAIYKVKGNILTF